ncbi:MAG: hypothetical protein H6595_09945 [Flavobacteriales bacterium]|nr:hypothetical protein [Flavobacteriales bacterium]
MQRLHPILFAILNLPAPLILAQNAHWNQWKSACNSNIVLATDGTLHDGIPEVMRADCEVKVGLEGDVPRMDVALKKRLQQFRDSINAEAWKDVISSFAASRGVAYTTLKADILTELDSLMNGRSPGSPVLFSTKEVAGKWSAKSMTYRLILAGKNQVQGTPWSDTLPITTDIVSFKIPAAVQHRLTLRMDAEPALVPLLVQVMDGFEATHGPTLASARSVHRVAADSLAKWEKALEAAAAGRNTWRPLLKKMLDRSTQLEDAHKQDQGIIDGWMLGWGWYTAGQQRLDPFGPDLPPAVDTSALPFLRARLAAIEATLRNQHELDRPISDFDPWIKERNDIHATIHARQKAIAERQDMVAARNLRRTNALIASRNLNEVVFHVARKDDVHFLRHHDATRNYVPLASTLRKEYLENEQEHILVHNYAGKDEDLGVTIATEPVTLAPPFVADLNAALGTMDELPSGAIPNSFPLPRQEKPEAPLGIAARDGTELSPKELLATSDGEMARLFAHPEVAILNVLHEAADQLEQQLDALLPLLAQMDTIRSILDLRGKTTRIGRPALHTAEVAPTARPKPPVRITYTLSVPGAKKDEKKEVLGGTYTRFRYAAVQVTAGLAWSFQPLYRVTEETDASKLPPDVVNDRLQFFTAIKWYPCGGDLFEKGFKINRHRWSLFAGISIPKPLDNLYAGAGLDVVPGVHLGLGAQFYRSFTYELRNGDIRRTGWRYQPVAFGSIGIDASLFAKLIKTLF